MTAQVKNAVGIDWKELKMPSAWVTQLEIIAERIDHMGQYVENKRGKAYLRETLKQYGELVRKMNERFLPKPPRTVEDAEKYALSRKFKGTYLALLNDKGFLVKVVILKRGELLPTIPEIKFEDRKVNVEMNQHLLTIPDLDFEKTVPKAVKTVKPFACDREKIVGYED